MQHRRTSFKPFSTTTTSRSAAQTSHGAQAKLHLPLPLSAVIKVKQQQLQMQLQQQLQQQRQQQEQAVEATNNEAQDEDSQRPHLHAVPSSNEAAKIVVRESDPATTSLTVELRRIIFARPGFYVLSVHAASTEQASELASSMKAACGAAGAAGEQRADLAATAKATHAGGSTDRVQDAAASGASVLDGTISEGAEANGFRPLSQEIQLQQQQQQQQQQGTLPPPQAKLANRFTPEVRPDFTVVCRLRGMGQAHVRRPVPHKRQRFHVQGRWVVHPRYGMQLDASQTWDEGDVCEPQGEEGRGAFAVEPIDLLRFKLQLSRLKGDTERASHSLSVTDLTAVDWCELQTAYQTVSGKPKVATAAMQKGSSMHQALEDAAVGVTIKVPVLSKEEDLAVSLLNIISCIRQLVVEGATRELRMMAPVQGQWLVGVVDSLQIDPATGLVSMTETKTRRQRTRPAEVQVRTAQIQVLMYHAMYEAYRHISLEELHHYLFKVSSHWVGLQPDKVLSPMLSALCAAAGIHPHSIHAPAEAHAIEQQGRQLLQHLVHSQATPSTQQRHEQQLQQWLQGGTAADATSAGVTGADGVGLSDQYRGADELGMGDKQQCQQWMQEDGATTVAGAGGACNEAEGMKPSTEQRHEQQLQHRLQGSAARNLAGVHDARNGAEELLLEHNGQDSLKMSDEGVGTDHHHIERGLKTGWRSEGGEIVEHQGVSYQQQAGGDPDEEKRQKRREQRQRRKQRAKKEREEIANKVEGEVTGGAGQKQAVEQRASIELQGPQQTSNQPISPLSQAQSQLQQLQQQQAEVQQTSVKCQGQQHDDTQQQHSEREQQEVLQPVLNGAQLQGVQQHGGHTQQQIGSKQPEPLQPALKAAQLHGQLRLEDLVQALHMSLQLLPGIGSMHGLEYLGPDGQCIAREEVVFNQHWLQSRLDTALGVWTGRAAPRPVDEDWKCSSCRFEAICWKYQPQDPLSQPSSLAEQTLKAAAGSRNKFPS